MYRVLGLPRRLRESDFHKLIVAVRESESVEEGRRSVKTGSLVDQLKRVGLTEYD